VIMSMLLIENPMVNREGKIMELFWKDVAVIGGLIYVGWK
jgi:hypothetical protein